MNIAKFRRPIFQYYIPVGIFLVILLYTCTIPGISMGAIFFISGLSAASCTIGYFISILMNPVPIANSLDEIDGKTVITYNRKKKCIFAPEEVELWYIKKNSIHLTIRGKGYTFLCSDSSGKSKAYLEKKLGEQWKTQPLNPLFITMLIGSFLYVSSAESFQLPILVLMGVIAAFIIFRNDKKQNKQAKHPGKPANLSYARMIVFICLFALISILMPDESPQQVERNPASTESAE